MIREIGELVTAAKNRGKKRLVAAYAQDSHTISAIHQASVLGLVDATLVGDPEAIGAICAREGIDPSLFNVISCGTDMECVERALDILSAGEADILMKGLVSTDKYMRGILNKKYGMVREKAIISHVVLLKLPQYHKPLLVSDVAVLLEPDLKQKTAMVGYLADFARKLGIDLPKVACISPSEQVLPNLSSSTDAAILSKMADRGTFGNVDLDGPLALDVALFREIAETKKLRGSEVAGDADCLLFPNLDSANVFFKSATQLCGGELACLLAGTNKPCVLTSRGDSIQTKLNSIAWACLNAG